MSRWIEVQPGVWIDPHPTDEKAATEFMNERLMARGYELRAKPRTRWRWWPRLLGLTQVDVQRIWREGR